MPPCHWLSPPRRGCCRRVGRWRRIASRLRRTRRPANQEGLFALPGELPKDLPTGSLFKYVVKLEQEKFYLFVPPGYRGREPYGLMAFINLEKAKSQVGIALITGPKDPNHGSIWSGYNDRLVPGKYRAKVFDVPGMGHQIARGQTLNTALGWIEAGNKKAGADRATD